jgi:hypothetical protein
LHNTYLEKDLAAPNHASQAPLCALWLPTRRGIHDNGVMRTQSSSMVALETASEIVRTHSMAKVEDIAQTDYGHRKT